MSRPFKERKVYDVPDWQCYAPVARESAVQEEIMSLTVEEYETIRLIDLEGASQVECAQSMEIARTTVQAIYGEARRKLAAALVYGRPLIVSGGTYRLCEEKADTKPGHRWGHPRWGRRNQTGKKSEVMKIAVTHENGNVFQHFGKSESFKIYTVEDDKIVSSEVVSTNGQGHGALGGFLTGQGADAVICGGIGPGAQEVLRNAGISLYAGVTGSCDEAVEKLLEGTLASSAEANCGHHGHGHGGQGCGHHGEGHGHGCCH